jgi:hypothetical protein
MIRYSAEDTRPTRDIVVGAGMSLHDLTRTVMCSFGLSDIFTPGGKLEVNKDCFGVAFNDWVKFEKDGRAEWQEVRGGVNGLPQKKKKHIKLLPEVSMGTLKATRIAQVLDKPMASSAARSNDEGTRSIIGLGLQTIERTTFCSQWGGGMLSAAQPCLYHFSIQLKAVGTKEDMVSGFQSSLPRCILGAGKVYGGNTIDYQFRTEQDTEESRQQIDELNCNFVGKRNIRGGVFMMQAGGMPDGYAIRGWQRVPLFEVFTDEDGESVAESYRA